MNYIEPMDRPFAPATSRELEKEHPAKQRVAKRRGRGGRLLGLGVVTGLVGALAFGAWAHYAQYSEVAAAAQARPARVARALASHIRRTARRLPPSRQSG